MGLRLGSGLGLGLTLASTPTLTLTRYEASLQWGEADPRHGIVAGGDEGDGFVAHYESYGATPLQHKYSCSSNAWRGFLDAGAMWRTIGAA